MQRAMNIIKVFILSLAFLAVGSKSQDAAGDVFSQTLLRLMVQKGNFFNLIQNSQKLMRHKFKETLEENALIAALESSELLNNDEGN